MARKRPPDVMDRLVDAATTVFGDRGLDGARMSDIAAEMGVAHGTLYTYVESKEALFALLVERGTDTGPVPIPEHLPVEAPAQAELMERLGERIREVFVLTELDAALGRSHVTDARTELEAVVGEFYDRTSETRRQARVLERSARDLPEMFRIYFAGVRHELFENFTTYVRTRRQMGHFRSEIDAATTTRFVLESVTYFARHRFGDPDPLTTAPDVVRATALDLIAHALLTDPDDERTA